MNDFVILTADLSGEVFIALESFRQKYFPVERNFIPAHLTLFHQFPREALSDLCTPREEMPILLSDPFFMGQGFAVNASCEGLSLWRASVLKLPFAFSKQDQNLRRLHVTIQNKNPTVKARKDYEAFLAEWKPLSGMVCGLRQWNYLGGPWSLEKIIPFSGSACSQQKL